MRFIDTPIAGVRVIELERHPDERGWFARSFCAEELAAEGVTFRVAQCNLSFNTARGTLRGMHYQRPPHPEDKIVCCVAGAIYDVVVDLRPESESYLGWFGVELHADDPRALYIPKGLAHGFQTLSDGALVHYTMSARQVAQASAGVRFDDPAFGIAWPLLVSVISERDRSYPDHEG